ncbi:hypothetical protein Ndes2526B_g08179 [Nannochloris sp. 'desiccata']|nr:hypothetical protein KSW81_002807 [Chlorella desiccata (nom. nud.)]KAH7617571.1 hypothetical protein NADE_007349 [Chlorella desiccata (nom. nud.)]
MRNISRVDLVAFALAVVLGPCQTAAAPFDGDVLIMRYGWAPLFCYSGSNSPVPREYCGLDPPALDRFNAHRALRIVYSGKNGQADSCTDPTSGYSPSVITPALRKALHCVSNSYTIGNDDGWWQFLWNEAGKCVAEKAGMTAAKYFTLMNNSFKNYNIDAALKKAKYDATKLKQVDPVKVLDILQKAFGQRGFYTCDNEITKCPAKLLKPNTKCRSGNLKIDTVHGEPVSKACLRYYPSFKPSIKG